MLQKISVSRTLSMPMPALLISGEGLEFQSLIFSSKLKIPIK